MHRCHYYSFLEYALKSCLGLVADRFRHGGRGRRSVLQFIRREGHADVRSVPTTLVAFDFSSLVVLEHLRRRLERSKRGEPAGGPHIRGVFIFNGGLFTDGHSHPWYTTPMLRRLPTQARRRLPFAWFKRMPGVRKIWSTGYHIIYNGYWFFGRPTVEELRQDSRAVQRKCRPDGTSQRRNSRRRGNRGARISSTPMASLTPRRWASDLTGSRASSQA